MCLAQWPSINRAPPSLTAPSKAPQGSIYCSSSSDFAPSLVCIFRQIAQELEESGRLADEEPHVR